MLFAMDTKQDTNQNTTRVVVIGAGLAGSEAALQLAKRGFLVHLIEMRPNTNTPVHKSGDAAELVCSNSLKSTKTASASGMLKEELAYLGSYLYEVALQHKVAAGGALAVDRIAFAKSITKLLIENKNIDFERREVYDLAKEAQTASAIILASGPLTTNALSKSLAQFTGKNHLSFFDAAAPIVMAGSLDMNKIFRQSRYSDDVGDYLNAPFSKEEYYHFIEELTQAQRVILRDFESKDLFQACQPIEEIARTGKDAPRFGPLKPVGLIDPRTGKRPWAAVQLRAEDEACQSYNLVGFQTNLTFPEQKRIFRMIPGFEEAEFARFGVMHKNTFVDAPKLLDTNLRLRTPAAEALPVPLYLAGQITGTEGYCEAIRSGMHAAFACVAHLQKIQLPELSKECAFGALLEWATNPKTINYQPMHVNFGIVPPLEKCVRNKGERYEAYATRAQKELHTYIENLKAAQLL